MSTVRWGLVSTANINRRLIPAIRASRRGQLTAVASRSQTSANTYAQQWDIPHAFPSYQAMLDSNLIDAVYISLPNHLHAEWTIKALRAGKHVLCEKPFAITLDEVDAMTAAAQETNCVLAEAFMYRHHPQTKIVGDWVQNGQLGDITLVRATFNFAFQTRDNIRLNPDWGGGCLWDVGIYPLSLAQYIYGGPPTEVFGHQWLGPSTVDENFAGQMRYPSGGVAQIASAFRTPWYTSAEIIGTAGRLTLNRPFTGLADPEGQLIFHPADGDPAPIVVPQQELYSGEVTDMHDAILNGTPPYLSLTETRHHIQTVLALYQSARTNQPIQL
ncbi:MAG TPA: Gfo/Idh/MocA family oxidoreductase [Anaerolineae bacterium]|nr:Gfo/Idh/MocA family oxidoreductase [Anaerolineae bacterium]